MIFKCVKAFGSINNISIIFKPHPIMNSKDLMKFMENLPKPFSFSFMPINTLFETADLVIYSDSTAAVDCISGYPVTSHQIRFCHRYEYF